MRVLLRKGNVRLLYEVRCQRTAYGMQEPRSDDPARGRGDERGKNQELQQEAGWATHSH